MFTRLGLLSAESVVGGQSWFKVRVRVLSARGAAGAPQRCAPLALVRSGNFGGLSDGLSLSLLVGTNDEGTHIRLSITITVRHDRATAGSPLVLACFLNDGRVDGEVDVGVVPS